MNAASRARRTNPQMVQSRGLPEERGEGRGVRGCVDWVSFDISKAPREQKHRTEITNYRRDRSVCQCIPGRIPTKKVLKMPRISLSFLGSERCANDIL